MYVCENVLPDHWPYLTPKLCRSSSFGVRHEICSAGHTANAEGSCCLSKHCLLARPDKASGRLKSMATRPRFCGSQTNSLPMNSLDQSNLFIFKIDQSALASETSNNLSQSYLTFLNISQSYFKILNISQLK